MFWVKHPLIWNVDNENKIISFSANLEEDFDEKYTLDFNKTKARFITKSPRDKTDRLVKTRIKFFDSEVFWIPGIEMLKE